MAKVDFHLIALNKLIEIKGEKFVEKYKESLYPTWNINGEIANVFVSLIKDLDAFDIFDAEGNLCVDETKKADEIFHFRVNLISGECKYIQYIYPEM